MVDEINNKKLNMVLFTNCHGERYIEMFKRDSDICSMFNIQYIVSYEQLNNFEHFKDTFQKADILIINNIKNYNDYTINNLKQILKSEAVLIVIPFVRFEGYWLPENYKQLKYIGNNAVSFFPNIDINNIQAYLNIVIPEQQYLQYFNFCLNKLKKIEEESDIKFYDFFINNHLKYPMFRDNYHPTKNMLELIASEIMKKISQHFDINYNKEKPSLLEEPMEYGHYKPILTDVKKILGIEYDLDKIFLCNREEYLFKIINYENNQNQPIKDLTDMKTKLNL
jgi:hypothetical protein